MSGCRELSSILSSHGEKNWGGEGRVHRHNIFEHKTAVLYSGGRRCTLYSLKATSTVTLLLFSFHHGHNVWSLWNTQIAKDSNDDCNYPCDFRLCRSDVLFGIDIRVITTFGLAVILCIGHRRHRRVSFPSPVTPLLIRPTTCPPWKLIWIINLKNPKVPFAMSTV